MPCTKYFWMNGYTQMMGTAAKMMQAAFSTSVGHRNGGNTLGLEALACGNDQVVELELQRAQRDILFNVVQRIGVGIPTANCIEQGDGCMMGLDSGTTIFARMVKWEAPSRRADSIRLSG